MDDRIFFPNTFGLKVIQKSPRYSQRETWTEGISRRGHFFLRVRRLCCVVLFSMTVAFLNAQAQEIKPLSQYIQRVWSSKNGLPQNTIQTITQTPDGYIWLGTQEGLVRFDGVRFTVFNNKNTPELGHNDNSALVTSRSGFLWIGNTSGILQYRDGQFKRFFQVTDQSRDMLYAMMEDPQGVLWIGTLGSGLLMFKDGQLTRFTSKNGLPNDLVPAICIDREGAVWIGTNGGLCRFKDGRFTVFTHKDGLPDDFVSAITEDPDGSLWIGTNAGLGHLKNGHFESFTRRDGLSDDSVQTLLFDQAGSLWIGTRRGGLNRRAKGKFSSYTTSNGLPSNNVVCLFQDREQLIWVGTDNQGLCCLWEGKFISYSTSEGLLDNHVRVIYEGPDDTIWIGSQTGGVARLKNGQITNFTTRDGLPDNSVRSLLISRDGKLWLGTDAGLSCFDGMRFRNYGAKDGLAHDYVRSLIQDNEGYLWVGTRGGGLHRFENGRLVNYRDKGIPANLIRTLFIDHEGTLWIGSNDGLFRRKNGIVTHYTSRDGLAPGQIYSIHEDSDHTLWLGTYGGGLNRLKNGKITLFTQAVGLFDDIAYQILEDNSGFLWMSCNRGIYRVKKQMLNDYAEGKIDRIVSESFGTADGMRGAECNGNSQPAGWKTRDGRLWFPTVGGVVVIDAASLKHNELLPLVTLEKIIVDGQAYHLGQSVVVPPGRGALELYFTGLSFVAPEKVRFKYQLKGFDPDWVNAGRLRAAYYTNLSPGKYTFKVIACNNDGVWNTIGKTIQIELKPHFYQTAWFYILCAVALVGIALTLYRLRVWQLLEREKELTRRVDEALADIKVLGGLIPICANCKKIRDDRGYWNQIEQYLKEHSEAVFSQGLCPDCLKKLHQNEPTDASPEQPNTLPK